MNALRLTFGSSSLLEHILRGVIGIGAVAAIFWVLSAPSLTSVVVVPALAAAAMIAFRGCPMCWTIGLFATAACKIRTRSREE